VPFENSWIVEKSKKWNNWNPVGLRVARLVIALPLALDVNVGEAPRRRSRLKSFFE
jgi:hypothetical protein